MSNSQKPTPYQLKILKDVFTRQKGWPVGINIQEKVGTVLVEKGLAYWATPFIPTHLLKTRRKLVSICCTTTGELYAKGIL